jgi:hypothetical protein
MPDTLASSGEPAPGTYRGLPRRTRQASLSPHLSDVGTAGQARDSARAATLPSSTEPLAAPVSSREPEQARSLAASLQSGWQRGRQADLPDVDPIRPTQATRRQDSEPPHSEET